MSFIIPCLPSCVIPLRTVEAIRRVGGTLIVVVDGEDTGGPMFDGGIILYTGRRRGPSVARNFGASHAQGHLLFFIDADVEAGEEAIERILGALRGRPEIAAAFGSYDTRPSDPSFVSQFRNLLHHHVHQISSEEATTFWSGFGAIRAGAFRRVGAFDESFLTPSVEDIELGARLLRTGERIALVKSAQVTHRKRWTLASFFHTDLFRRAAPWSELIFRRSSLLRNDLNLGYGNRVSVLLVLCQLALAFLFPALAVAAGLLYLGLNYRVLRFFREARGLVFALKAVPLIWLHHVACLAGLLIGFARAQLSFVPLPLAECAK